jgi:hypothetical protein
MSQSDVTPTGPLRVGVGVAPDGAIRVRAVDLRALGHQTAVARAEHPGAPVLVDIDVVISDQAQAARALLARFGPKRGDTLLYVGTPAGLAGLITDIHSLGIADGAVLLPMTGAGILDLIYDDVLPRLSTTGPVPSGVREARPA